MIFKKKESTQELLGIEAITDYGMSTKQGELVFFSVAPTNLSVLPADSIDARINALLNIIKGYDGIEMIATDSMQSFEYNKRFYRDRLEKENCPAVRRLLEQDIEHLDRIQVMTASSRQFYNTNDVVLTWKRTNSSYYDTLVDDCHVYVFGLDLTKKFSDGKGDLSKVEFCLQNDADEYYVVAKYDESAKAYYVTGSTDDKSKATRFTPRSDGRMLIYGIEDDAYTITELKTDGAYTLLKNGIGLVISVGESSTVCGVYSSDVLGLIQNDPRYADVEEGLFHNMPQKHLEHKLLTASAKVDNKQVSLGSDNGSANAFVPLTVVNTKGFDLPKTGGYGNWMFPAIGLSLVAVAVVVIYFAFRDKKKETNK